MRVKENEVISSQRNDKVWRWFFIKSAASSSTRRHQLLRRLSCEEVESRLCLSEVSFAAHEIHENEVRAPKSVYAADLDGDGDKDVLSASSGDSKIAWYDNTDGMGHFGPQQVISTEADEAWSVLAADVDGDGDMDVVSAGGNKIAWYRNTDGRGTFGEQRVISTEVDTTWSAFAADLDSDGDVDVLSGSIGDGKLAWYENIDGNGSFGGQRLISVMQDDNETAVVWSVFASDIDGDGDQDAIAGWGYGHVHWFENTDGKGDFSEGQFVAWGSFGAGSIFSADVDGDDDMDVLSASFLHEQAVAWHENVDGDGTFGERQLFIDSLRLNSGNSVFAADIDGDGDVDVLAAASHDDKIAWHENADGKGGFRDKHSITTLGWLIESVYAADLDGDGDVDVLSASSGDDRIAWYENTDGRGTFGDQQNITTPKNTSVYAADLDGDGDVDVISPAFWHANVDGNGSFSERQPITTMAGADQTVFADDLDGDGDTDVVSTSLVCVDGCKSTIGWYENIDGNGRFGARQPITERKELVGSVDGADVDGDGDVDVIASYLWRGQINWYENTDGAGTFGPRQTITKKATGAHSVRAADLDGDGDVDVLSASSFENKIAWYENTDGKGDFGDQQAITTKAHSAYSVFAADVDGDGDMDVLSASRDDNKIAWYENTDRAGTFGPQLVISSRANGARSVFATDLDGDGDTDVLSASFQQVSCCPLIRESKIAWYENIDGAGMFGPQQIIAPQPGSSVFAVDLDDDGDMDVLSEFDGTINWYENLSSRFVPGDANRDFRFDQQDIVLALQAAKYLTGEPATWEEGDWNEDGMFDQLDIVASLQHGQYLGGLLAAIAPNGTRDDDQTSIVYDANTGEVSIDAPHGNLLTSIRVESEFSLFDCLSEGLEQLEESDQCGWSISEIGGARHVELTPGNMSYTPGIVDDVHITFGSISLGTVLPRGLPEQFVLHDLQVTGSLVNGDELGDLDLVYTPPAILLPGDANGDFSFDRDDILQILVAGKYLTGESATWEQGDWNYDGVFDQVDVVTALQTGTYQRPLVNLSELVEGDVELDEQAFLGSIPMEPTIIRNQWELHQSIKDRGARNLIRNQVDFTTQQLFLFSWTGSSGDTLLAEGRARFTFQPGRSKDMRAHTALFATVRYTSWSFSRPGSVLIVDSVRPY